MIQADDLILPERTRKRQRVIVRSRLVHGEPNPARPPERAVLEFSFPVSC